MATPKMFTDGTTGLAEAALNKAIQAGEGTVQTKMWCGRVRYTGAVWEVHATTFSAGITSVAWSVDHINITLSGFTQAPCVVVSPTLGATRYRPEAIAASSTQVQVQFKNAGDTVQTVQGTDMDCYLIIWGN